jgi:hypothetical protein
MRREEKRRIFGMAANKTEFQCSAQGHNFVNGVCEDCGDFEVQLGDYVRHKLFYKQGRVVGFDFERSFPIMVKVEQADPKAREIIYAGPDELEILKLRA